MNQELQPSASIYSNALYVTFAQSSASIQPHDLRLAARAKFNVNVAINLACVPCKFLILGWVTI